MNSQERIKLIDEILNFCDENDLISFYEFKEYAFNNSKDEWINGLRDKGCRMVISEHLKGKRRREKRNYSTPQYEAMHKCACAGAKYYKQKEQEYIKELDAMEDSVEDKDESWFI